MKRKETVGDQLGYAYTCLTVVFTIFMVYLKYVEGWPVPWLWVFAPIWVSIVMALLLIGLTHSFIFWWDYKNRRNEKTDN